MSFFWIGREFIPIAFIPNNFWSQANEKPPYKLYIGVEFVTSKNKYFPMYNLFNSDLTRKDWV